VFVCVCVCIGEFTAESRLLVKIEREKLQARTDPWKVHFHSLNFFHMIDVSVTFVAPCGGI